MAKQVLDLDDAVNIVIRLCKAGVALNKYSLRKELEREAYTINSMENEIEELLLKTVIPHRNYENLSMYWCDCGWFLRNKDNTPNYCPNCGKRIEWGGANDKRRTD